MIKNDLVKKLCNRIESIAMNESLKRDEEEKNGADEEPDEEEPDEETGQPKEDPFVKDSETEPPMKSPAPDVRQASLFE